MSSYPAGLGPYSYMDGLLQYEYAASDYWELARRPSTSETKRGSDAQETSPDYPASSDLTISAYPLLSN